MLTAESRPLDDKVEGWFAIDDETRGRLDHLGVKTVRQLIMLDDPTLRAALQLDAATSGDALATIETARRAASHEEGGLLGPLLAWVIAANRPALQSSELAALDPGPFYDLIRKLRRVDGATKTCAAGGDLPELGLRFVAQEKNLIRYVVVEAKEILCIDATVTCLTPEEQAVEDAVAATQPSYSELDLQEDWFSEQLLPSNNLTARVMCLPSGRTSAPSGCSGCGRASHRSLRETCRWQTACVGLSLPMGPFFTGRSIISITASV